MDQFRLCGRRTFGNLTGDGISNLQKYQSGLNPDLFYPLRLAYWQFNNPPNWLDTNGLAPNVVNGIYPVPSWSGDAVMIVPLQNGDLGYPGTRTNGSDVTVCPAGTGSICFWFKPNWVTGTSIGYGPNDTIRLFEIGRQSTNAAYGWFALTINTMGNRLTFSTEANGIHTDNAILPINLPPTIGTKLS